MQKALKASAIKASVIPLEQQYGCAFPISSLLFNYIHVVNKIQMNKNELK